MVKSDQQAKMSSAASVAGVAKKFVCNKCATAANKTCARCGDFYCSKICQQRDWQRHRYTCFPMPPLVVADEADDLPGDLLDDDDEQKYKVEPTADDLLSVKLKHGETVTQDSMMQRPQSTPRNNLQRFSERFVERAKIPIPLEQEVVRHGGGMPQKEQHFLKRQQDGRRMPQSAQQEVEQNMRRMPLSAQQEVEQNMRRMPQSAQQGVEQNMRRMQPSAKQQVEENIRRIQPSPPSVVSEQAQPGLTHVEMISKLSKIDLQAKPTSEKLVEMRPVVGKNIEVIIIDNSLLAEGVIGVFTKKESATFINVHKYMSLYQPDNKPYTPILNEFVLAKYEDAWYRGLVVGLPKPGIFEVLYIDYTNKGNVSAADIRAYPVDDLKESCCSSLCALQEIPAKPNKEQLIVLEKLLPLHGSLILDVAEFAEDEMIVFAKSSELMKMMRDAKIL